MKYLRIESYIGRKLEKFFLIFTINERFIFAKMIILKITIILKNNRWETFFQVTKSKVAYIFLTPYEPDHSHVDSLEKLAIFQEKSTDLSRARHPWMPPGYAGRNFILVNAPGVRENTLGFSTPALLPFFPPLPLCFL